MIHARTKIIALIALTFFMVSASLCGGFFWIVNAHKDDLFAERTRAAEAEVEARALTALEATVANSKEDRAKLAGYILRDDAVIDLLSLIEQTALEQGTELKVQNLTTMPIDDMFEELEIAVLVSGSFDGVMRVLRILEQLPQQSSVPQIQIQKEGEEEADASWRAEIDMRVTKFKKI